MSAPYACENGHFHKDRHAADMCDDLARAARTGLPARQVVAERSAQRSDDGGPIPLTRKQIELIQEWAANDRLWGSRAATETNLYTFARLILKYANDETEGR